MTSDMEIGLSTEGVLNALTNCQFVKVVPKKNLKSEFLKTGEKLDKFAKNFLFVSLLKYCRQFGLNEMDIAIEELGISQQMFRI